MAVPLPFLVLCACVLGLYRGVEATPDALSSLDASFCQGGLEVVYPELDVDECLVIPKDLREKMSTVWNAPNVYFPGAQILAELGSIAQAALREQRLDISLILIPSRVHSKNQMYVLVMVDPDAPSHAQPKAAYWRHWLVVDVQGDALKKGQIRGTALTNYQRPTPPRTSGFHRYQFMLFEQHPDAPVSLTKQEKSSSAKWDLWAFITRFDLGEPVATVQFLTQNYKA